MAMFKAFGFKNYKCFSDIGSLELAPLTVLCGTNSSGKSSIIDSLLLQKQSFEDRNASNFLCLSGEYVKGGSYHDLIIRHDCEKDMSFNYSFFLPKVKNYTKNSKSSNRSTNRSLSKRDIIGYKNLNKVFENYENDGFLINFENVYAANMGFPDNYLKEQKITINVTKKSKSVMTTVIYLKNHSNKGRSNSKYDITFTNFPNYDDIEVVLKNASCYFENAFISTIYSSNIEPSGTKIAELLGNLYTIYKVISMQFSNLHYLTPLRVYPQGNYSAENYVNEVGISGENTPSILASDQKDKKLAFFKMTDEEESLKSYDVLTLEQHVQNWMEYLGFKNCAVRKEFDAVQVTVGDYKISNVGFGASQVLPIITEGILLNPNELLCLEQPEIHLHPKAQMAIADFLIAMAVSGRGVIVETHSDHVINRIVRRMMEDPQIAKNTKIYFVDQDNTGTSNIESIKVDPFYGVIYDNKNFFTQFASETERIMFTGYNNSRK